MIAEIDEPIRVVEYDPRWVEWYAVDSKELAQVLGARLREMQHFGSTSVPGIAAKPIIDILVAPAQWPLTARDRETIEALSYEHLGEAGVAGREYFRRRSAHDTNIAVVEWRGTLWRDNLLFRDFLRAHADAAAEYARLKSEAWENGARTLIAYSERKAHQVAALLQAAKAWRAG